MPHSVAESSSTTRSDRLKKKQKEADKGSIKSGKSVKSTETSPRFNHCLDAAKASIDEFLAEATTPYFVLWIPYGDSEEALPEFAESCFHRKFMKHLRDNRWTEAAFFFQGYWEGAALLMAKVGHEDITLRADGMRTLQASGVFDSFPWPRSRFPPACYVYKTDTIQEISLTTAEYKDYWVLACTGMLEAYQASCQRQMNRFTNPRCGFLNLAKKTDAPFKHLCYANSWCDGPLSVFHRGRPEFRQVYANQGPATPSRKYVVDAYPYRAVHLSEGQIPFASTLRRASTSTDITRRPPSISRAPSIMQKVWRRGSTISTTAPEAPVLPSTAEKGTETDAPPAVVDKGVDPVTINGVDKGTDPVAPSVSDGGVQTIPPAGTDKATETIAPSVSDGGVQTEEQVPEVFQVQVGDELVMEQPLAPGFDERIVIKVADVLNIDKLAEDSNTPEQEDKQDDKEDDSGSIEPEHMNPEHQVLLEELTRETKRLEEMRRQLQAFVEKHGIDIRLLDHWEKYSSQSTELKKLRPRCLLPSEALRERHELMKESLLKVEEGRAAVRHRCIEALEKITRELQGIPALEDSKASVEIPDDKVLLDQVEEEGSPSQAKPTTDIKEMSTLKRLLTRIGSMISSLTTPRSQSLFNNAVWYAKLAVRNLSLGYLWHLTRWPTNVVCQPFLRCGGWLFEPQRWATLADRSEQRLSTIYRILVSACAWEAIFWAANASRRQENEAAAEGGSTDAAGQAAGSAAEGEESEIELWKRKKEEEITHWLLCEDLERARGALKELEGAKEAEEGGWEMVGLEGLEELARVVHGEPAQEPASRAAVEAE